MKGMITTVMLLSLALPVAAGSDRQNPTKDWLPENIDWDAAETVEIRMQDYFYEPNDFTLRQDVPYRLILNNVSNSVTHDMAELDFFHAVVLEKLHVDGVEVVTPHIHQVRLRANSKTVLYLVPKVVGEYDIYCSIPGHREHGMDGHITIIR